MFSRTCQTKWRYNNSCLDHKSEGENSVNNLQYRPETRLLRGICDVYTIRDPYHSGMPF